MSKTGQPSGRHIRQRLEPAAASPSETIHSSKSASYPASATGSSRLSRRPPHSRVNQALPRAGWCHNLRHAQKFLAREMQAISRGARSPLRKKGGLGEIYALIGALLAAALGPPPGSISECHPRPDEQGPRDCSNLGRHIERQALVGCRCPARASGIQRPMTSLTFNVEFHYILLPIVSSICAGVYIDGKEKTAWVGSPVRHQLSVAERVPRARTKMVGQPRAIATCAELGLNGGRW